MQVQWGRVVVTGLLALVAAVAGLALVGPVVVGLVHREAWSGASGGVTVVLVVAGLLALGLAGRLAHLVRQGLVRP